MHTRLQCVRLLKTDRVYTHTLRAGAHLWWVSAVVPGYSSDHLLRLVHLTLHHIESCRLWHELQHE